MFGKKHKCSHCKKELKKNFDFCPYCGASQNKNNEWGMLGKNDLLEAPETNDPFSHIMPGFGGNIFNKMIGNAMKMLEQELQREMQSQKKQSQGNQNPESKKIILRPNAKMQLYINGKKIDLNNLNENALPKKKSEKSQAPKKLITKEFSKEAKEKFSKMKKQEPETNLRRLSNRIIYELKMPGVKSLDDVSIRNLEKSIEIKAIGKAKAYYKIIPVDLPLLNYNLEKDLLVLELEAKN